MRRSGSNLLRMSAPGWYPDPENPDRVRYWDGTSWAGTAAPHGQGGPRRARWVVAGAAALAVVVLAVLLLPRLLGAGTTAEPDPEPTGPRPTESQWDERPVTETPTPTPSDEPSSAEQVPCPRADHEARSSVSDATWIRGGGLAFPAQPGWDLVSTSNLPWATDVDGQRSMGSGWYNVIMVGQLQASDGFTDARTAALSSFDCQASGSFYSSVVKAEVLGSEATQVQGSTAWHVHGIIHSSSGLVDRVEIVVVEQGDALGVFHAVVNSEETERVRQVEEALAGLVDEN